MQFPCAEVFWFSGSHPHSNFQRHNRGFSSRGAQPSFTDVVWYGWLRFPCPPNGCRQNIWQVPSISIVAWVAVNVNPRDLVLLPRPRKKRNCPLVPCERLFEWCGATSGVGKVLKATFADATVQCVGYFGWLVRLRVIIKTGLRSIAGWPTKVDHRKAQTSL